eukprot:1143270-Pelagomonas_calceolata.AAC.3
MGVISLAEQERHATPRGGMNNDSRWGGSSMSWNSDAFHTCSDGHLARCLLLFAFGARGYFACTLNLEFVIVILELLPSTCPSSQNPG